MNSFAGWVVILFGVLAFGPERAAAQAGGEIHLKPRNIQTDDPFYQVESITIRTKRFKSDRPGDRELESLHRQFSEEVSSGPLRLSERSADPMSIAEIALKAWGIVQDNRAVLNVSTMNSKALPYLAKDHWEALTGWKPEHGVEYALEIKNVYGITVVDFRYEVRLIYGGSIKKRGKYIASARVVPKWVNVLWGFSLDVSVREVAVQNLGTPANPFASIVLEVGVNYGSILKKTGQTISYRLNADGEIQDLANGRVFFQNPWKKFFSKSSL